MKSSKAETPKIMISEPDSNSMLKQASDVTAEEESIKSYDESEFGEELNENSVLQEVFKGKEEKSRIFEVIKWKPKANRQRYYSGCESDNDLVLRPTVSFPSKFKESRLSESKSKEDYDTLKVIPTVKVHEEDLPKSPLLKPTSPKFDENS